MPPFDGLHPLVVHFPIALLVTTPLFLVLALLLPARRLQFATAALILMLLGSLGAIVAVRTGEATEENAERIAAAKSTLHEHEELAERTRLVFIVLTAVYAAMVLGARKLPAGLASIIHVAFLLAFGGGLLVLVNTADRGGRLVHQYGAHAPLGGVPVGSPMTPGAESSREADDD